MGSCGARPSPQELVEHYEDTSVQNDASFYHPVSVPIPNRLEIEWTLKQGVESVCNLDERLTHEIDGLTNQILELRARAAKDNSETVKFTLLLEVRKGVEIFSPSPSCTSNSCYIAIEVDETTKHTEASSILYLPKWYQLFTYNEADKISSIALHVYVIANGKFVRLGTATVHVGNYLNRQITGWYPVRVDPAYTKYPFRPHVEARIWYVGDFKAYWDAEIGRLEKERGKLQEIQKLIS